MTVKTNSDLDRKEIFANTEHLYSNPKNYKLYVSKSTNAILNRRIKNREIEITLKDLIDSGGELRSLSEQR